MFQHRRAMGELSGRAVVLVDVEPRLMAFYRAVQCRPHDVLTAMDRLPWGESWRVAYDVERTRFSAWTPAADEVAEPEDAARMLWVNRACFNGLYRVSSTGAFNTPAGSYKELQRPSRVDVLDFAESLVGVELVTASADTYIEAYVDEGDQLYGDPPYHQAFDLYTKERFPWSMHVALAQASAVAHQRGAHLVLSNSCTPEVVQLYLGLGFDLRGLSTNRSIGASADTRKKEREVLIIGRPGQATS